MPIRALTFDFWNTIVDAAANSQARRRARTDQLHRVASRYVALEPDAVEIAQKRAASRFVDHWHNRQRTLGPHELVSCVWETLGVKVDALEHEETVTCFEESLFVGPPLLAPGLVDTLDACRGRFRIGIISDTMFSPGRVLRRYLDDQGLLGAFDAFVFSDETGCSKPDPRAFNQALDALGCSPSDCLHIGDLRRTDIAGARGLGIGAVLYTGIREDDEPGPEPDHVLPSWSALPALLARLN